MQHKDDLTHYQAHKDARANSYQKMIKTLFVFLRNVSLN